MAWWVRLSVAATTCAFGCAGDDGESLATGGVQTSATLPAQSTSLSTTTAEVGPSALEVRPQALVIESQSGRIEVGALYFGTSTVVADGTMPRLGHPLVEGMTVELVYSTPGWTFTAEARPDDGGASVPLEVTVIDEHRFAVTAPSPGS